MIYPFITLDDGAEIVHSEMQDDGRVKVYVEKADEKEERQFKDWRNIVLLEKLEMGHPPSMSSELRAWNF